MDEAFDEGRFAHPRMTQKHDFIFDVAESSALVKHCYSDPI